LFNKIRDENDEGDFSDRREIMYRLYYTNWYV
jgi:hypothetical protein